MMSIVLATAFLFPSPQATQAQTEIFSVGSLTGAAELTELRAAILEVELPLSVRTASLDRYADLLKSGAAEAKVEDIIGNIRQFIEPNTGTSFHVEALSSAEISVTGTTEQVQWVYGFLDAADDEGFLDKFLDVQIQIYRLPAGTQAELLGDSSGKTVTADELAKIRETLSVVEEMELVTAPRVTVTLGARANISVLKETAYVKDYDLTILPDMDGQISDPVIGRVQEGLSIDVRALPVAKETLMLHAEFILTSLKRPLREETRKVGGTGAEVTIQIPEVRKVKAAAQFELKDGASLLLRTVDPGFDGEAEQDLLVVISASLIE
ncbi:MAG: hypothetical protein ACJAQ3_002926 [Planctomycetota bacterium]|jgi:hypothetical protein